MSGSKPFVALDNMRIAAQIFQLVATAVALIIGGIFAWNKFIRRGEHDPRLQPNVAGTATLHDRVAYVIATATVQNTGQVDVELDLEACALDIYTTTADDDEWNFLYVVDVFEGHEMAQPNETIEDQVWLEIPVNKEIAIHLELTVAEISELSWVTTEVISLLAVEGRHNTKDGRNSILGKEQGEEDGRHEET